MEFHKNLKTKNKPDIITKKKIAPKARIFSSLSQSNLQTGKQNKSHNRNITETLNKDMPKFNKKYVSSSLVINLRPKHQVKKPVNIYNNQIRNPNPMKQLEYQLQFQSLNSSKMSIPSTNIINANVNSRTNSKDKNSNSSLIGIQPRLHVHRSANNINCANNNELEIEINPDEDQSPKHRYHRSRKFSPFYNYYNNIDNEEIIYNMPYTDEESIEKIIPNQYYDAYEMNEGLVPMKLRMPIKRINRRDNNNLYGNPFLYSSDEGMENENSVKYEEDRRKINFKKKYVRNYTDIYDPNKNNKGLLLQKYKQTIPLSQTFFDGHLHFFARNSKLSDLIMAKKKYSPDPISFGYEEFFSGSEDKTTCQNEPKIRNLKTFNRRSFEKFSKNKTLINMHKSPEQRFKNFSLAMISSKGKNTENRPIFREMRFEKGGVVDLSPSNARKNRYKYLIRKMKRTPGKQLVRNNPKYREKAAELIQEWWKTIKEYRKKRIKSAILIQSYFRGRFVRKYLYDVIYMNYLYFGFCKKIEKFTKKKYGPYFFEKLFGLFIKRKKVLKSLISNYENKMKKIFFNKWKKSIKDDNRKKLSLLYLLRIRVIRDSKIYNLNRFFNKWYYTAIIKKERSDLQKIKNDNIDNSIDKVDFHDYNLKKEDENKKIIIDKIKSDSIKRIKGLLQIINGTQNIIKKKVMQMSNPLLIKYLKNHIKKKILKKILKIRKRKELIKIKKYFYTFYDKCFNEEIKNKKKTKKYVGEYDTDSNIDDKLEKLKKEKEILKKMKIELFIKKIESYISGTSKQGLHNLFLNSILSKIDKLNQILEKMEKKKEIPEEKYFYKKDYKYKKVKRRTKVEEDENDSNPSESEEQKEKDRINKTTKKSSKDEKQQKMIKKDKKEDIQKKKKYNIKKEEKETDEERDEDSDTKIKDKKKKKFKKPFEKDDEYEFDDLDEEEIGKNRKIKLNVSEEEYEKSDSNDKKPKTNKNEKSGKKTYKKSKTKEIPSSEGEEEIDVKKNKAETTKKAKEKEKDKNIPNKKIYLKKKIINDTFNTKDNNKKGTNISDISSDEEENANINKNSKKRNEQRDKQRKYRKIIYTNKSNESSEEESSDENVRRIIEQRNKKRSLSLDKISEKSKEVSDYIKDNKDNSSLSIDDQQKRNNSEIITKKKIKGYIFSKDKQKQNLKDKETVKKNKRDEEEEVYEDKDMKIKGKKDKKYKKIKNRIKDEDNNEDGDDEYSSDEKIDTKYKKNKAIIDSKDRNAKIDKDKNDENNEEENNDEEEIKPKDKKIITKDKEKEKEKEEIYLDKKDKKRKEDNENSEPEEEDIEDEEEDRISDRKNKKITKYKKQTKYKDKTKKGIEQEEEYEESEDKIKDKKVDKDNNQIDNNLETLKSKEFINFQKKYILKNILKIKKDKINNKIRYYFNNWKFDKNRNIAPIIKQNNDKLSKKYAAKIIYMTIKNLNKKLVNSTFNKWRRLTDNVSNEDNSLKKSKNIYVFSDIIRNIINKKTIKDLISKLNKHKVLQKIIINLIKKKDNKQKEILLNYLLKWYNDNELEKSHNLNDILLNIFKAREKKIYEKLSYNIRKWNMISNKLSCIYKIELIQKHFRNFISKKENNKLKTWLNNIAKNKIIYALNDIARLNILKESILYIPKNKVIFNIKEKINKNKIEKLLDKIIKNIDKRNNNAKMKYYIIKWKNRVNFIKNKDNKKLKVLLMRIFNKKDNLNNVLKSYYSRWKRIINLLSITNSVVKIQKTWRKKKAIDKYNKMKENQNKVQNILQIYKKKKFISLINKIKDRNKKYLLTNIENNFTTKKNDNLKYVMDRIKTYIKNKYLFKTTKLTDDIKNRFLIKCFNNWKNKTNNTNKAYKILNKIFDKKEFVNRGMILSGLLKWLYNSKCITMEKKVIAIQKKFRIFKNNNSVMNKWYKLKKLLNDKICKNEIKDIIKKIKIYQALNRLKNKLRKKICHDFLNSFNRRNKMALFTKKMKKILSEINDNKSSILLKKYYLIWKNNINKEIEREEKLNDLLYTIEKRMNINSANFLSYVSLLKHIFDGVINLRKIDCFRKLREFYEKSKNIDNLSKDLSRAYKYITLKKQKILISKILKYFVYHKFLKLFERIKQRKEKKLKLYKSILMTNLKKYLELSSNSSILSDNSKKKRFSIPTTKMVFKPKQKIGGMKKNNITKTKSQSIIKVGAVNKDQKKTKEKEKFKDKEKSKFGIRKNIIVKGSINKNNKKNEKEKDKNKTKEKENEDVISILSNKSEEQEIESDNENMKDNINYLCITIEKVFKRKKKESLFIFKEIVYKRKTEKEKEEEKIVYTHKLYKALKKLSIKKIFIQKEDISRAKRLIHLVKLTAINAQICKDRWNRQLLRRWRFISFVKNVSKKKLELMYKNLHVGYLEIINSLFNNESQFPSMIKEFEKFGADVGMYKNSDYYMNREKDLYQKVKKKYISKPIEYDRENSLKIESGKFINDFKYKSDDGEDTDFMFMDSDKDVLKKQKGIKISNNYDWDK